MNNEVQAPLRIPQLSNFTRQPHLRPTSPNVFLLSIRRHSSGYQRNDLCVCSSCKVDGPGFESFRIHLPNSQTPSGCQSEFRRKFCLEPGVTVGCGTSGCNTIHGCKWIAARRKSRDRFDLTPSVTPAPCCLSHRGMKRKDWTMKMQAVCHYEPTRTESFRQD